MKTYNQMVREAREILSKCAEDFGVHRQEDLALFHSKTGLRFFGPISIVRGYTLVCESGLVAPWCGRFGCGFYVDSTMSSIYSWRNYYLFIKPLSAFFSWAMSREMALAVVNLARENGFVLVDIHHLHHSLVSIPAHLTARSRDDLHMCRFMLADDYERMDWCCFDSSRLKWTPYDNIFSLIDKVSFDDIRFRASIPLVPPKADF